MYPILQYVLQGTLSHTSPSFILFIGLHLSRCVSLTMTAIVSSGLVFMMSYGMFLTVFCSAAENTSSFLSSGMYATFFVFRYTGRID